MAALVGAGIAAIAPLASADVGTAVPNESAGSAGVARKAAVSDQLARALAYEHGEGVPKDQKIAAAVYCDAAVHGSAEAAYQLGWMYAYGRGVARDDGTASALFELAASDGHPFARKSLARIGDAHGMLPDCMRPVAPPMPDPVIADADDGPDPFEDLPPDQQKIADLVNRIAPRYGIDPRLALSVIAVESNFDVLARSAKDARGLMQLIPQTAARFNVRNPYNVLDNVRGGLAYLRWLLAYYRGEVVLAAAAYNAGEGAVDRYGGVPPYAETREYVRRVMTLFRNPRHPYDPAIVEPSVATARADPKTR
ncbi:MAG TPA: transglycosylase SLT domain-containing protein [Casimicrobiaceae bacterium]